MTTIRSINVLLGALAALLAAASPAAAEDRARSILNGIDPKNMNELLEAARSQPDAALTSVTPLGANKFRFLFVWPASNTVMTYDRIGRSFAERFLRFAENQKLLAVGYCLTSKNMFFGSAVYAAQEVNVAYRDIEVAYRFGAKSPCAGRYLTAADLDQAQGATAAPPGYGGGYSAQPLNPPDNNSNPEESLKPFLNPPALPH